jgi:hypothetical protein
LSFENASAGRHGAWFARFVQTGTSTLPEVATSRAVHKTGKPLKLLISVKPIYGAGQKIVAVKAFMRAAGDQEAVQGLVGIGRNVHDRRSNEARSKAPRNEPNAVAISSAIFTEAVV